MKIPLLMMALLLGGARSGLWDSVTEFFSGSSDSAEEPAWTPEKEVVEYKIGDRPIDGPKFDTEINSQALTEAYAQTESEPGLAGEMKPTHGEPAEFGRDGQTLDFEDFLSKIANLDCSKVENGMDAEMIAKDSPEDVTNLCEKALESGLLTPLSRADQHAISLFNFLKKNVYNPLGIDLNPKYTFHEVLTDGLFGTERHNTISKDLNLPTAQDFFDDVAGVFGSLERDSVDFDSKRNEISEQIVGILKKFHIFWNVHRARGQLDTLGKETLKIIKGIVTKHRATTEAMRETTTRVLGAVKSGYFKFLRAHRMWEALRSRPIELVALQAVRRYKENVELIRSGKSSTGLRATEIAFALDLQRAFLILNFNLGIHADENQRRFKLGVSDKIAFVYEAYRKHLVENGENVLDEVRTFTATLLLKMSHRIYIIFTLHTMETYVRMPAASLEGSPANSVRVYYEIFDQLLLAPSDCPDLTGATLESCVSTRVFALLQALRRRAGLASSVAGSSLLEFLRSGTRRLFRDLNEDKAFESFPKFKRTYMARLFKFAELFRQTFKVRDMAVLDRFEADAGALIEAARGVGGSPNLEALETLDKEIYEFFLKTKVKFNQFAPLNRDFRLMRQITRDFEKTVDSISFPSSSSGTNSLDSLLTDLKRLSAAWLRDHSVFVVINAHGVNTSPLVAPHDALSLPPSALAHEALNRPGNVNIPPAFSLPVQLLAEQRAAMPKDTNNYL